MELKKKDRQVFNPHSGSLGQLSPVEDNGDFLKCIFEISSTEELHPAPSDWQDLDEWLILIASWLCCLRFERKQRRAEIIRYSSIYFLFLLDCLLAALIWFEAAEDSWVNTLITDGCLVSKKMAQMTRRFKGHVETSAEMLYLPQQNAWKMHEGVGPTEDHMWVITVP